MTDRLRSGDEPHSSIAKHAQFGEEREAYQLWPLEYTDDDQWVCVGDNCRVEMTPCCWKWSNEHNSFLTKSGERAKYPPYFRAEGKHALGCQFILSGRTRDHAPSEFHVRVPSDYPARVKLSREMPGNERVRLGPTEPVPTLNQPELRRARSTYGIQEACEYYTDHPNQHQRPLRVDGCPGSSYEKCFVRLGTGNQNLVGRSWIFYDQFWFADFVELRRGTETFVLPLLTTVYGEPRRLVVRTSNWAFDLREHLRKKLLAAIKEAKAARQERIPKLPWIFFYAQEARYNQLEIEVDIQPGVGVLVRDLSWNWNLQPGNSYRWAKRRQHEKDNTHASPTPNIISTPIDSPKPEALPPHTNNLETTSFDASEPVEDEKPASSNISVGSPRDPEGDVTPRSESTLIGSDAEGPYPKNEDVNQPWSPNRHQRAEIQKEEPQPGTLMPTPTANRHYPEVLEPTRDEPTPELLPAAMPETNRLNESATFESGASPREVAAANGNRRRLSTQSVPEPTKRPSMLRRLFGKLVSLTR